jgi:transposase
MAKAIGSGDRTAGNPNTMLSSSCRKDARGIAQLICIGWFRPVHYKSVAAQETRSLLGARKLLQSKLS